MDKWLTKRLHLDEENSVFAAWLAEVSCLRLFGLLLAIIGWIMCVTSTAVNEWRVWDVENVPGISSGKIWIGIWRTCFIVDPHDDEPMEQQCLEFYEQYGQLPKEIFIAQDFMSLACVVQTLAIGFMAFALWNIYENVKQRNLLFTFFTIGGILNLISCIIILIPLSWNLYSVVTNEGIEFPETFYLPQFPKQQRAGFAIYVGFFASAFKMASALVILSKKCRRSRKLQPLTKVIVEPSPGISKSSIQTCPHCGSSVDLAKVMAQQDILNI